MAVTIFPLTVDEQLALTSACGTNIAAETPSTIAHQEKHKSTSLDDFGLLLSVSEIQEALGLGRNSTYNLLRSGKLKSIRVGRLIKIPKAALDEYLRSY